jgi:hypothetical protein
LLAPYKDWFKLGDVLEGKVESCWSELVPKSSKQALVQKCLYLCRVYTIVLQSMDKSTSQR